MIEEQTRGCPLCGEKWTLPPLDGNILDLIVLVDLEETIKEHMKKHTTADWIRKVVSLKKRVKELEEKSNHEKKE